MNRYQVWLVLVVILSVVSATLGMSGCATTWPYEPEQPAISCPEGTHLDLRENVCVSNCYRPGERYDSANKGCVSICGAGYEWDGRKCVSVCVGETTWDGLNQACACPAGKYPTKMGRCLTMEEAKYEEEKARKAEFERIAQLKAWMEAERAKKDAGSPAPTCKAGTEWDMFVKQCITICKGGQWNDAQATCLCPQGMEWVPIFRECIPTEKLQREPSGPHGPKATD